MQRGHKIILGILFAGFVTLGSFAILVVHTFTSVPNFEEMRDKVSMTIYMPNGDKKNRIVGPHAEGWVPIKRISNYILAAVIASEDTTFYIHKGIDYHELQAALKKDFEEKRWARGASTITQQVVKNVYLARQKTLWRKVKEFIWAPEMEKVLSKSEILCFYANIVEWGPNIYGVKAAASHYFSLAPAQVSARQAAFLAMLLPSPVRYHQYFERRKLSPWATRSVNRILNVMHGMGFLDDDAYQTAMRERLWGEEALPGELANPESDTNLQQEAPAEDFGAPSNSQPAPVREDYLPGEEVTENGARKPRRGERPGVMAKPYDPDQKKSDLPNIGDRVIPGENRSAPIQDEPPLAEPMQ